MVDQFFFSGLKLFFVWRGSKILLLFFFGGGGKNCPHCLLQALYTLIATSNVHNTCYKDWTHLLPTHIVNITGYNYYTHFPIQVLYTLLATSSVPNTCYKYCYTYCTHYCLQVLFTVLATGIVHKH